MNADRAMQLLEEGNARFAEGRPEHPNAGPDRVLASAARQAPFVTVLACSDSRVPVERVFDRGVGELFVIRVAGNVVGAHVAGSAEFGVSALGTQLIVVLGHTGCGAVEAAVKGERVEGPLGGILESVGEVVERVRSSGVSTEALLDESIRANVRRSMRDLLGSSRVLRDAVGAGRCRVVGAIYDLETGVVVWLDEDDSAGVDTVVRARDRTGRSSDGVR